MKKEYNRQLDLMHSTLKWNDSQKTNENIYWQEQKTPAEDFYYKSGNPFLGFLQFFKRKEPLNQVRDVNKLLNDIKGTNNLFNKVFKSFLVLVVSGFALGIIGSFLKIDGIEWIFYCIIGIAFIVFAGYVLKIYYHSKEDRYNIYDYKRYIMDKVMQFSELSSEYETVYEPSEGIPYNVIMDTMLFDKCYFKCNENFLTGIHNGIYFAHTDIEITYDNESVRSFFDGHILSLKCPNDFRGTVTITDRQYKSKAKWKNRKLIPIMTNDNPFNDKFIVHTDDESLAGYILTPQITRFLLDLKQKSNSVVLVSFRNGYMYILIDDKQVLFEVDTKNPDINNDTNKFRNSLNYICNIINQLCI